MGRKIPRAHNEAQGESGMIGCVYRRAYANLIQGELKHILTTREHVCA